MVNRILQSSPVTGSIIMSSVQQQQQLPIDATTITTQSSRKRSRSPLKQQQPISMEEKIYTRNNNDDRSSDDSNKNNDTTTIDSMELIYGPSTGSGPPLETTSDALYGNHKSETDNEYAFDVKGDYDYSIRWIHYSNENHSLVSYHDQYCSNATTTTTTTTPIIPPPPDPVMYHEALIETKHDSTICIKGFGQIKNESSDTPNNNNNDTPSSSINTTTTANTKNESCCYIQGYRFDSSTNDTYYMFDSATWSSWITISLGSSSSIRIVSSHSTTNSCMDKKDAGYATSTNSSSNSTTVLPSSSQTVVEHQQHTQHQDERRRRTFDIYNITDRTARPTIIPDSWVQAVEHIVQDATANLYSNHTISQTTNINDNGQRGTLRYSNLSFFQESVHDDDDVDDEDARGTTNVTDPTNIDQYNWKVHGYQILIGGAKSVGKSTCLRYCLNQLLNITNVVMVLDIDPGQPIYTMPGMLQLTKVVIPNFVPPHLSQLIDQQQSTSTTANEIPGNSVVARHYFGSVTSEIDPTIYTQCVASLLNKYKECCKEYDVPPPLLINLDGWTKDMGFEILTAFIQDTFQLRHVIQISGHFKSKMLDLSMVVRPPTILHECYAYNVLPIKETTTTTTTRTTLLPDTQRCSKDIDDVDAIDSSVSDNELNDEPNGLVGLVTDTIYSDKDNNEPNEKQLIIPATSHVPAAVLRDIRLITYFIQPRNKPAPSLLFEISAIWDRIVVSNKGIDDTSSSFLIGNTLAHALPYVISIDAIQIRFTIPELHNDIPPHRYFDAINGMVVGLCTLPTPIGNSTIHPVMFNCLGLGLVRAVDRKRRLLYLLTPLDHDKIQAVDCLTIGSNLHLPVQCYFRGAYTESFPYIGFQNLLRHHHHDVNDSTMGPTVPILGSGPMKSRNNINRRGRLNGIGP